MLLLALVEMIYVLSFWVTGNQASLEPGWSSLMFVILVIGGILMILLGFIGVYIGLHLPGSQRPADLPGATTNRARPPGCPRPTTRRTQTTTPAMSETARKLLA
jgi:hypothetical protein